MTLASKFPELCYERISMDDLKSEYDKLNQDMDHAKNGQELVEVMNRWMSLRSRYITMKNLNYIYYTQNTADPTIKAEKTDLDNHLPKIQDWNTHISRKLLHHPYRKSVEEQFGQRFLDLSAMALEIFDAKISEHLKKESALVTAYIDLLASAQIEFQGKTYNLSTLAKWFSHVDRNVRHEAYRKKDAFFEANGEVLDQIYSELVRTRHEMAQTLGYPNFVHLGYRRMFRTDYNPKDVAVFREEVLEHVVPVATSLRAMQAKELGLDEIKVWDESVVDQENAPKPQGDTTFIVHQAARMFERMSSETSAFFETIFKGAFYDLEARTGKAGGGYCIHLPHFGMPFIFCNFNGTRDDIRVFIHECGHAFQKYCSRDLVILDYFSPTSETAEIHSMSMEFLSWPWMNLFFGEKDAMRYRKAHLKERILFLPYGCAIDEFQHFVYENPLCSPKERKAFWKTLEAKYLPWRKYEDLSYMQTGGFWQNQRHIYRHPFYYIDYVLALTCALQIWRRSQMQDKTVWNDYLTLCKLGGSRSFLEAIQTSRLQNPFKPGVLADIMETVNETVNHYQIS